MNFGSSLRCFRLREFNRNVRSFFLYGIFINAGMALFSLLYNLYLLRLSYQEDFIGQLASMAPLATALVALPAGLLSDRFGRKLFLVASGILLAGSQLGLCLATSPTTLLAYSFVGGIASAFVWVNHVPFLSDNAHPTRRAEALVIWSALQVLIRMLLSLAGGFLPSVMGYFVGSTSELPEPFRYSLLCGAGCSLAAVLPLLNITGHTSCPHSSRDDTEPYKSKNPTSSYRIYSAVTATSAARGFSMGLTYPFFNVFFEEELHIGPAMIGAIFFLSQVIALPATLSAPNLVRRFGPTLTILPARTVGGTAIGIMGSIITLPTAVTMFLLARAGEVIDNPSDQYSPLRSYHGAIGRASKDSGCVASSF